MAAEKQDGGGVDLFERMFILETMIAQKISAKSQEASSSIMGHHAILSTNQKRWSCPDYDTSQSDSTNQKRWIRPDSDASLSDVSLPDLDDTTMCTTILNARSNGMEGHSNGIEALSSVVERHSNQGSNSLDSNDARLGDGKGRSDKSRDVSHRRDRKSHSHNSHSHSHDKRQRRHDNSHRRHDESRSRSGSDSRAGSRRPSRERSRYSGARNCDSSDTNKRRRDTTRRPTTERSSPDLMTSQRHKVSEGCYRVAVQRLSPAKIRKHQCSKRRHKKIRNASDNGSSSSESESDSSSGMTSSGSERVVEETSLVTSLPEVNVSNGGVKQVVSQSLKRRRSDVTAIDVDNTERRRGDVTNVPTSRHFSNVFSDLSQSAGNSPREPMVKRIKTEGRVGDQADGGHVIESCDDHVIKSRDSHVIESRDGTSKENATWISSDSEDDPVSKRSGLPFRRDREILVPCPNKIPTAIVKPIPRTPTCCSATTAAAEKERTVAELVGSLLPEPKIKRIVSPVPELSGDSGASAPSDNVSSNDVTENDVDSFDGGSVTVKTERDDWQRHDVIFQNDVILIDSNDLSEPPPHPRIKRIVSPVPELSDDSRTSAPSDNLSRNDVTEIDVDRVTVKTECDDSGYGDEWHRHDVIVQSDVIVHNDVILIDSDECELPDLLPKPEPEVEKKVPQLRPILYSDCLQATPLHGHYDVISHNLVPAGKRVHFTFNQCSIIEGCLEEVSDQKFLSHALWWLDYGLIERELPTKFTRQIAKEVLLASQSPELSFRTHACLLRAIRLHPPTGKIAYNGEYVGAVLSHLGSDSDPQTLLNYSLTLDYLVQAFQCELFTRKLLNSRDLKRSVIQNDIGTGSSDSHRDLKYIFKKLNILASLTQCSESRNRFYLSPRKIFSQISRLLEMIVVTSPKSSDSVDRICESLVNFTKVQNESVKNLVFENLTSPLLRLRFVEVYQNWHRINDVVAFTKTSLNQKTVSRVCLYLEAQVLVAKGDLTSSLPQRLMTRRFQGEGVTPQKSAQPITSLLTFGRRHLEKIIGRVKRAMTRKPELVPYLMRLDILMESIFES